MDQQPFSLEERRSRLVAAVEGLEGLDAVLHQGSGSELAELMTLTDRVASLSAAARVSITVEAVNRGEVAESGSNVHTWVCDHAPSLRQGGAGAVVAVAQVVATPTSVWRPEGADLDPDSPQGIVWAGVVCGAVSPSLATAVLREVQRLEPRLVPEALPTVTRMLVELGTGWGVTTMR
ncbi:MAG: HNH endonuclease, partial [Ornithinibacter sp.]